MKEYLFSDRELTYLGYFLFTIDGDEPEDWEQFDFGKEYLDLLNKLYNINLEIKLVYASEGKFAEEKLKKKQWKIALSEEQIDIIVEENAVALQSCIEDSEFEEFLEEGNSLLLKFSKPTLSKEDLLNDS